MTRLLAVLSAAALVPVSVTGVTAAPTTAAPATLPTYVSVSAIPSTLVKGDSVKLPAATCRAAPGATIAVERRLAPDGDWFTVDTTTLDSSGATTLDLAPRGLTTFDFRTVLTAGSASRVQSVTVVQPTSLTPNVGVVPAAAPPVAPLTVFKAPATLLRGRALHPRRRHVPTEARCGGAAGTSSGPGRGGGARSWGPPRWTPPARHRSTWPPAGSPSGSFGPSSGAPRPECRPYGSAPTAQPPR